MLAGDGAGDAGGALARFILCAMGSRVTSVSGVCDCDLLRWLLGVVLRGERGRGTAPSPALAQTTAELKLSDEQVIGVVFGTITYTRRCTLKLFGLMVIRGVR